MSSKTERTSARCLPRPGRGISCPAPQVWPEYGGTPAAGQVGACQKNRGRRECPSAPGARGEGSVERSRCEDPACGFLQDPGSCDMDPARYLSHEARDADSFPKRSSHRHSASEYGPVAGHRPETVRTTDLAELNPGRCRSPYLGASITEFPYTPAVADAVPDSRKELVMMRVQCARHACDLLISGQTSTPQRRSRFDSGGRCHHRRRHQNQ